MTLDARSFKFIIKKTINPNTGKSSTIENEFSAQNWNAKTLRYLRDIHALGEERFKEVLNMASNNRRGRIRANPEPISNKSDDSDDTLRSEDDNEGDEECTQAASAQDDEDSESSF